MEYTQLGKSGLKVSRICLGCMSYGEPGRGAHPWSLPLDESLPYFKRALEAGITFFDTANVYSAGSSEEIVGQAIKQFAKRDEVVVATKLRGRMRPDANGEGLSRKAIFQEIDASLKRLQMDYVDLYQIHRWDYSVPLEETLEALDDLVKAGKVRYLGASSMFAWQFAKSLYVADLQRRSRFVSMQNHYNLLYREEEREMNPLCIDQGVGLIPWSPLARGRLTRDLGETTARSESDEFGKTLYRSQEDVDREIIARVKQVADERAIGRAQVALAWLLSRPGVTSPIVGATKMQHLDDSVAAVQVQLSQEEIQFLEAPYTPRGVVGFS